jgi:AcrR family transcriptional regulator
MTRSQGRRLAPEARRDQIIDIGAKLFATQPYEQVRMTDIAAVAGISRALVYRYFPTKRDLFAAIYQRAADQLLKASELGSNTPFAEQVLAGLEAHFDFFAENARTVLVANRGALAGDPMIEGIISNELAELRGRMLDATGLLGHARARAGIALYGWLAFVRAVCVEWLAHPDPILSREEVRDMCMSALTSALAKPGGTGVGSVRTVPYNE